MRHTIAALLSLLAFRLEGQEAAIPPGPITLLQAISRGRERGIEATIAQLNLRAANARTGERRADLLPTINGRATLTRQTLNLDEFGIPIATGVTDPFSLYNLQIRASQTVFDASAIARHE